jgi:arabinan endo-1,5-alpha-L-arabinosidase
MRTSFAFSLAILCTSATQSAAASHPAPHTVTGDNVANTWGGVHVHDPSIVLGPDGKYYSFTTHPLIAISSAPSLDGYWTHLGNVLSGASKITLNGNTDLWAPDVRKVGSTYYLYYSVSTFGSQESAIGLATSTTLLPGSWTDHGQIIRSGSGQSSPLDITNAIDPNLFIDPKTNTAYLSYGSFYGDIWQFRLNSALTAVTTNPAPVQISLDPAGTRPEEGAFISYASNGYYYLWISHGICCGFDANNLPAAGTESAISQI